MFLGPREGRSRTYCLDKRGGPMRSDLVGFLLILIAAPAFPQTAAGLAAISGVVRDASGVAVPNANVVVSSSSRSAIRTITTNSGGVFTALALLPGAGYKVAIT